MKKIWCLFSIENNYDQPDNNLVAWWEFKPDFETLADGVGIAFKGDENILSVVKIHQGETQRITGTDFRLEELGPGKLTDKS